MAASSIEVTDDAAAHRFEIRQDGRLAGFSAYRVLDPARYAVYHTEIDEEFAGRGLGSRLVGDLLAQLRERGISVLPECPFVRRYLAGHPELITMLPNDQRATFELADPA